MEETDVDKTLIVNSNGLKEVDYKNSNILKFDNKIPNQKLNIIDNDIDEGYFSDEERKPTSQNPATDWEDRAYRRQQAKKKDDFIKGEGIYEGQTEIDLSHHKFIGAMNLDGNKFPKSVTSFNLGDNYLTSLKVVDFPNLQRLIISHNTKLTEETITIDNCPKLDKNGILFYDHKSNDETRTPPPDAREYDEERDNHFKKQQQKEQWEKEFKAKINQQVRDILTKKEENITLQELLNLFKGKSISSVFDSLEKDIKDRFQNLFKRKLESHILDLVNKVKNGTLNTNQLIKEIDPLKPFLQMLSDDTKSQLRNLLETSQKEEISQPIINYFPLTLILIAFFGIGAFTIQKQKQTINIEKQKLVFCRLILF